MRVESLQTKQAKCKMTVVQTNEPIGFQLYAHVQQTVATWMPGRRLLVPPNKLQGISTVEGEALVQPQLTLQVAGNKTSTTAAVHQTVYCWRILHSCLEVSRCRLHC
jgi:hypothetical protein